MASENKIKVMFVDDDEVTGRVMQRNCDAGNYECRVFSSGEACLTAFRDNSADIVITDLRMPGMGGFELLSALREIDQEIPVLVMTGYSSVENAVEAMKRGATDFIKKPFDFQELRLMIERTIKAIRLKTENKLLKRRLVDQSRSRFGIIGESPVMKSLFSTIEKVAEVNCCAIINGESGTGKELVARALHDYSPRKDAPFVAIDCGALSDTLLESELFGHEKGAFTGAAQRKHGLMEQASGGTLFLDEICNISDMMQIKLMRAIEEKQIIRVGGTSPIPIDLRVVAASNRDLEDMAEKGEIRHDFYHRLNVVNLHVPSLAERRQDIPLLVEYFVKEFANRYNRDSKNFDSNSLQALCEADWKGNIRELRNTIERCVILADGPVLQWSGSGGGMQQNMLPIKFSEQEFLSLIELEQEYINHVLRCCKGKKTKAAKVLGIDKTTLWRKLRRYDSAIEWV
ncbi:MAG: sigma-54 dependent transcriptional regulator [Gammaproteobacteria bacterium]|nr:sigma-54 dependent transcriptional regulator [Gammaproteobacteria bacterium]MDH5653045.1 sigma-54 dependent transcriptional regulator [Gammaproteobacteria bacterium]